MILPRAAAESSWGPRARSPSIRLLDAVEAGVTDLDRHAGFTTHRCPTPTWPTRLKEGTSEIDDGSAIYDGTRAVGGSCHLQQRTASAPRSIAFAYASRAVHSAKNARHRSGTGIPASATASSAAKSRRATSRLARSG